MRKPSVIRPPSESFCDQPCGPPFSSSKVVVTPQGKRKYAGLGLSELRESNTDVLPRSFIRASSRLNGNGGSGSWT